MRITHNSKNDWRDEAKVMGLDKQLYPWINDLLAAQSLVERQRACEIVENMRWPEYVDDGSGGMFGSSGWATANHHAQKAQNKDIDKAKKLILGELN